MVHVLPHMNGIKQQGVHHVSLAMDKLSGQHLSCDTGGIFGGYLGSPQSMAQPPCLVSRVSGISVSGSSAYTSMTVKQALCSMVRSSTSHCLELLFGHQTATAHDVRLAIRMTLAGKCADSMSSSSSTGVQWPVSYTCLQTMQVNLWVHKFPKMAVAGKVALCCT